MRIAILGASSQIAKDLIISLPRARQENLLLYVRNLAETIAWLELNGLRGLCKVRDYKSYGELPHEVVFNFVGVGDPLRAAEMGPRIFELTMRFDDLVLEGLARNPARRYFFISSGAVFGNNFDKPVTPATQAVMPINGIAPRDYYGAAKLYAEVRHRAWRDFPIIDLRIFNMFSRTQDMDSRFFITDIVRAIRDDRVLQTSADYIVRDFMHPEDFHGLVERLLMASPLNCAIDCYSREPIDKPSILQLMAHHFGLRYNVTGGRKAAVNATGLKTHYYSLNRKAAEFGYHPRWSSAECILAETAAVLGKSF